jgi:redox-sensitive bicupin YhaK (pirin superfamily)
MKTILHRSDTRGFANHGWLNSHHSFSFASYHNPERMNFGRLRVLNDDIVQPKMGFGTHPHRDMEIISIPLSGALSHKDSMGNTRAIAVGEVQVMSAGTGLTHSEFNDSKTESVNFLQLWIIPEEMNVSPNYEQRVFSVEDQRNQLQTVVAPKDKLEGDALPISQQAYIYRSQLDSGQSLALGVKSVDNGFYIFVLSGEITVASAHSGITQYAINSRDAIGVWDTTQISIKATSYSELLIIEVPMT